MGKPTGKYRKKVSTMIILAWLKQGYTMDQIKEAAAELRVKVEPEEAIKAIRLFCEWKEENPTKQISSYKCTKNKRYEGEDRDES